MREKEEIISTDTQGWPVYKMNLKDILLELGAKINKKKRVLEIPLNKCNIYPTTLEDDGMGYGINEKYICEVTKNNNGDKKEYIHFFIEPYRENLVKKLMQDYE